MQILLPYLESIRYMNTLSYKELLLQREALDLQIASARKSEFANAVQTARSMIQAFSLTPQDVFPSAKQKRKVAPVTPKYRDAATGKTWTGRGKPPSWIKDQDRSKFEI